MFLFCLSGACPRLERIEVHIGISDYFMDVDNEDSKRNYARIVKKLAVNNYMFTNSQFLGFLRAKEWGTMQLHPY